MIGECSSFELSGETYLVEAKRLNEGVGIAELGAFHSKLEQRYGVSRATIRRKLRKAGYHLRDVKEASRVRRDVDRRERRDRPQYVPSFL